MIINLTQHLATPEQIADGVVDMHEFLRADLTDALTFDELPDAESIEARADYIAELACQNGLGGDDGDDPQPHQAMIGGAPYLMPALVAALRARRIEPLYSFTRRDAVEQAQDDGSVRKIAVFRHVGWVAAT